jgi:hypothetical protein
MGSSSSGDPMRFPFVIDNHEHRLPDALNGPCPRVRVISMIWRRPAGPTYAEEAELESH